MSNAGSQLPNYDRVLMREAELELCLVQMRFSTAHRFSDERYLSAIKEELADEYPLTSTDRQMNVTVTPQGVVPEPGGTLLRFSTVDHGWSVILSNEVVSVESRQYSDIDELTSRFSAVLALVAEYLRPKLQLRFGLRYINEFRFQGGESFETWRLLLNRAVLGLAAEDVLGGMIEQTIAEVRTRRGDGTVVVRHGFLQGTSVMPIGQRQPKTGPFYLLDLDYFEEKPIAFDPDPAPRMRAYNDVLYRVFRWFVGDGPLYEKLKGEQP
jgi:uncharacterized protein (TIGR04255 family)